MICYETNDFWEGARFEGGVWGAPCGFVVVGRGS